MVEAGHDFFYVERLSCYTKIEFLAKIVCVGAAREERAILGVAASNARACDSRGRTAPGQHQTAYEYQSLKITSYVLCSKESRAHCDSVLSYRYIAPHHVRRDSQDSFNA
jgi:hypothetical protein